MAKSVINTEINFEPVHPDKAPLCDRCRQITYTVFQATCCGAYFCEACKSKNFQSLAQCSYRICARCRGRHGDVSYDFNETRKRKQFEVYCRNKQAGCPCKDERGRMDDHLRGCLYEAVPCKHEKCKQNVLRKDLQRHQETCPDRMIQCKFCKDFLRASHLNQYHLHSGCQDFPKDCPHKCGEKVTDRQLVKHKETCSHEPLECLFAKYGCTETVPRHYMNQHVMDFKHMKLLLTEIENSHKTQQTMQQTIQSQQAEVQSLKNYVREDVGRFKKAQKEFQTEFTQNYKKLLNQVTSMDRDFQFHKKAFESFKTEYKMAQDDISKHFLNHISPLEKNFQLLKETFENFKDECEMIQDGITQASTLPFKFIVNNAEELTSKEESHSSPYFYTACRRHKLKLIVFPGGKDDEKGQCISVWLYRINTYGVQSNQLPQRVKIQVVVELLSQLPPKNESDNHVVIIDAIVDQNQQEEVIFKKNDFIPLRNMDHFERRKSLFSRCIVQYKMENSLLFRIRSAIEVTL